MTDELWVKRWAKSETFWQGVAIQTIGTLIAALIIAIGGIALGFIPWPHVGAGLIALVTGLLTLVVELFVLIGVSELHSSISNKLFGRSVREPSRPHTIRSILHHLASIVNSLVFILFWIASRIVALFLAFRVGYLSYMGFAQWVLP